ncbi:hypothetical protein BT63DRAFT_451804 [Microthyrium microscopicum]|uniref:LsmAD domain-containing protein n=1 Tax=Microthyrium microscopicum TaxID=703497 RepID=A0A6A6UPU3_9PEZI|nr:hypothetical protein BT63DRAFT_451804 [Microthyrium microscopicum]
MSSSANGNSRLPPSTSSSPVHANPSRTSSKMNSAGGKPVDGQRKQTSSPMDPQSQRKQSVPNAWAKGSTNPVTQRPAGTLPSNGTTNTQNKQNTAPKGQSTPSKETNTLHNHFNDRLHYAYASYIGLSSTVTLQNGEKYTGVFSSATSDQSDVKYLLKMVKRVGGQDSQVNGASDALESYVGNGEDHVMTFLARDVELHVPNAQLAKPKSKAAQNGASGFKTDTDISGGLATRERALQPWDGGVENDVDMSLDGPANGQPWDQFEANQRLYGVQTNYDESYYTTTIDRSRPDFKERENQAARIAREIETSSTSNSHVAEERGQKAPEDNGEDEESKYSGVQRDFQQLNSGQPNKYTPPARRAPSAHPTVSGAPVDPAIISSSLAKGEKDNAHGKENESATKSSKPPASSDMPKIELPKPQASVSGAKPILPAAKVSPAKEGGATATVEKDVVNAFKQFTANEKLKAQEHQRSLAKRDKAVKLNDLKKFAQNFKLNTPVPQDLVPILAKDTDKQQKIVEKALKNVTEQKTPKLGDSVSPPPSAQPSSSRPPATLRGTSGASGQNTPPSVQPDRQSQRSRQSQGPYQPNLRNGGAPERNNQSTPNVPRQNQQQLAHRLQQQYPNNRQAMPSMPHLQDPRVTPTGPMNNSVQSPTSRMHYNAKMPEFKPNPAANTFQPITNNSSGNSPVRAASISSSAKPEPKRGNFWEGRRAKIPAEERKPLAANYNPITRLKKEVKAEGREQDYLYNGGIPQAYRTQPIWEVAEANKEQTYNQVFEKENRPSATSPQHHMSHQTMPHQHQLPIHLQPSAPIPVGHTPQHTPRHANVQPHMGPNGPQQYDDHHRMQYSASSGPIHPSPRGVPPFAYNAQGGQPMQGHPQPMPGYGMSPSGGYPMQMRQVSNGPPHYMNQGPPQMGGHVMTNQQSSGPYMNYQQMNPQMPMMSPGPNHAYPHPNGPMPSHTGANGFGSPRPPAPMMAHQGSQQGHHPAMYMSGQQPGQHMYSQPPNAPMGMRPYGQPGHYGSSPHQHHGFPQQPQPPHRATPSASYAQPMMGNHNMQPGMPPTGGQPMGNEAPET